MNLRIVGLMKMINSSEKWSFSIIRRKDKVMWKDWYIDRELCSQGSFEWVFVFISFANRVMKKDLEKRMTELRVLEKRLEVGFLFFNDL